MARNPIDQEVVAFAVVMVAFYTALVLIMWIAS